MGFQSIRKRMPKIDSIFKGELALEFLFYFMVVFSLVYRAVYDILIKSFFIPEVDRVSLRNASFNFLTFTFSYFIL